MRFIARTFRVETPEGVEEVEGWVGEGTGLAFRATND
jgi:hypothetical protein